MGKNITIRMGNCNHRKYIPMLLDIGSWKERLIRLWLRITGKIALREIIDAYKHFDKRDDNWIKVMLTLP